MDPLKMDQKKILAFKGIVEETVVPKNALILKEWDKWKEIWCLDYYIELNKLPKITLRSLKRCTDWRTAENECTQIFANVCLYSNSIDILQMCPNRKNIWFVPTLKFITIKKIFCSHLFR